MRASTHQLIIDLTNSTSTRQPGLLFDPVFSVRKSPCVLRGSVAPLCSPRPRSLAGRLDLQEVFDRRYMPVKWSHRIPPVGLFFFFFNRRNQRRMCEAALSCYDTISGTGGRWSMTGRAARGERERRRKEKTSSRPAATPHEHNQRLFYTLGSRVMGWEINKKVGRWWSCGKQTEINYNFFGIPFFFTHASPLKTKSCPCDLSHFLYYFICHEIYRKYLMEIFEGS